jgi:Domain of unknown function (DUF6089)
MKKLILLTLLLSLFFLQGNLKAQGFNKKNRYTSIGGSINAMNYVGDLDPGPSFISPNIVFTRENLGVEIIQRMWPRVSFRGSAGWGIVKGDDKTAGYARKNINRTMRNLNFRSQIVEVKVDVIIDLWENRGKFQKRPDYTPYFFGGINYFHMNPKGKTPAAAGGNYVALRPLHTDPKHTYSLNQIAIPIGLGFRYKLSKQLDIAFEMGWRFTLTDYLDDCGGNYTTPTDSSLSSIMADRSYEAYQNDPTLRAQIDGGNYNNAPVSDSQGTHLNGFGRTGDKRADKNRDWYIVTGFHLTYILPGKVICPKFR